VLAARHGCYICAAIVATRDNEELHEQDKPEEDTGFSTYTVTNYREENFKLWLFVYDRRPGKLGFLTVFILVPLDNGK